jgi:hypothetical protein
MAAIFRHQPSFVASHRSLRCIVARAAVLHPLWGWSRKGNRAVKKQVFVKGRRASLEALLTLDGIVARTVVEGSMTKDAFLEYVLKYVLDHLCSPP